MQTALPDKPERMVILDMTLNVILTEILGSEVNRTGIGPHIDLTYLEAQNFLSPIPYTSLLGYNNEK